jgi:hypothetical protein
MGKLRRQVSRALSYEYYLVGPIHTQPTDLLVSKTTDVSKRPGERLEFAAAGIIEQVILMHAERCILFVLAMICAGT